jgi:hypothetical protein
MGGLTMFLKAILPWLGCLIAWFLLLPIFVIGGGSVVILYAALSEFGAILTGSAGNSLDPITAREMARRICLGYGDFAAV